MARHRGSVRRGLVVASLEKGPRSGGLLGVAARRSGSDPDDIDRRLAGSTTTSAMRREGRRSGGLLSVAVLVAGGTAEFEFVGHGAVAR
jgi:hypothetical protein